MGLYLLGFLCGVFCIGCSNATRQSQAKADAKPLESKSVYEMTPRDIGQFAGEMRGKLPDLPQRVVAIARRNLGQPYKLHLLGEFPFEAHDNQPLYCLENGDCVVFAEHAYAMSLSHDWESFFTLLQRIRYKGGEISALTRNHYMLADWNENNSWLLRDVTIEIAGEKTATVIEEIDRKTFFQKNFALEVNVPVQNYEARYVPAEFIKDVASKLANGDCVNLIRRKSDGGEFCGHVGLIALAADGTVNFIDSTQPKAMERPLVRYVEEQMEKNKEREANGRDVFLGMKFLRLQHDPLGNLLKIDGPDAPIVTGPRGLIRKAGKN